MERGNGVECGKFLYRIKKTTQGLYLRNLFWFLIVNHTSIIVIGGTTQIGEDILTVEHISTTNNTCKVIGMEKSIYGNPMVFTTPISEDLLVCGGNNNFRKCKILVDNRKWKNFEFKASETSHFNSSRIRSCAATTRHASYIFGGTMGENKASYEYMLASEKIWRKGKMLIPDGLENGCAVTISDDEIWLIGGEKGKQKKRVLSFNTTTHNFTNAGFGLKQDRWSHRCSLMPDKSGVMVTGGTSKSTEIINLKTRKSTVVGSMKKTRALHGIGTLVINNAPTLVVFGGYAFEIPDRNISEVYHDSFEKYDPRTQKWSIWDGATLKTPRRDFGFATLKPSMICKDTKK